jgi:hypothetical protein
MQVKDSRRAVCERSEHVQQAKRFAGEKIHTGQDSACTFFHGTGEARGAGDEIAGVVWCGYCARRPRAGEARNASTVAMRHFQKPEIAKAVAEI